MYMTQIIFYDIWLRCVVSLLTFSLLQGDVDDEDKEVSVAEETRGETVLGEMNECAEEVKVADVQD
ncbi:hypothetical protein E2C01_098499 [Portunus trituberculatus]|uniref:Uncharacterized protein n=1 Tax=Portunus trituberculatus TaxID=210409 RepID=A0A5B7K753_PORTR|nr:hypothetical protein [Portunus trituberculatus]